MHSGQLIFSQIMGHHPMHTFSRCVSCYQGNFKVKRFTCWDQYYAMAFAQRTYWESLRDIEACLSAQKSKLHYMGIHGGISRTTLAKANEQREWRIYADFAYALIPVARIGGQVVFSAFYLV